MVSYEHNRSKRVGGACGDVLRRVKQGETVEVMEDGKVVARLTPARDSHSRQETAEFIADVHRMAAEVNKYVRGPVDADEIVREIRREL